MHSERELGNGALAALVQLAEGQAGSAPASAVATIPAIVLRVGARWYGVDANLVREVVHRDAITRVPAQPGYVLGVTLVHGRMVAVIDLDRLLDKPAAQATAANGRFIVLHDGDAEVGVAADEARGVIALPAATAGSHGRPSDFVIGEVSWNQHLVCMLDARSLVAKTSRSA